MSTVKILFRAEFRWYGQRKHEFVFDGALNNGVLWVRGGAGGMVSLRMAYDAWKLGAAQVYSFIAYSPSAEAPKFPNIALFSSDNLTWRESPRSVTVIDDDKCMSSRYNGVARIADGKVVFHDYDGGAAFDAGVFEDDETESHFVLAWRSPDGDTLAKYGIFDLDGKNVVPFEFTSPSEAFKILKSKDGLANENDNP